MRPVVMYVLTSHSRMFARVSVFVSSAPVCGLGNVPECITTVTFLGILKSFGVLLMSPKTPFICFRSTACLTACSYKIRAKGACVGVRPKLPTSPSAEASLTKAPCSRSRSPSRSRSCLSVTVVGHVTLLSLRRSRTTLQFHCSPACDEQRTNSHRSHVP